MEELKRNGGVGYTEKAKVLTFDGDTTGKESNGDMIKISGEYIDLERVTALSCFVFEYGEEVSVPVDELNVFEFLDCQFLATPEDHFPYIAASAADNDTLTKGIYVFATANAYISRIEFAEAVHTIDPKYLPEPVKINLADCGIDLASIVMSGGGLVHIDDVGDFWRIVRRNFNRPIRFVAQLGDKSYELFPSAINNGCVTFSITAHVEFGVMLTANIYMGYSGSADFSGVHSATIVVSVSQAAVPQL